MDIGGPLWPPAAEGCVHLGKKPTRERVRGCPPKILFFFFRRRRTLLANERKSARQPDPRRVSRILQALNWLTRPVYSSGDPLRSPCLGSSLSSISLAVSFASKVLLRQKSNLYLPCLAFP